jgi:thiol:disulfide interchange protein
MVLKQMLTFLLFFTLTFGTALTLTWVWERHVPEELSGANVIWLEDYSQALAQSKAKQKPLLIDFHAKWCAPCRLMERTTFKDAAVVKALEDFIALKLDVDTEKVLADHYGIRAIPTIVVANFSGKTLLESDGYLGSKDFMKLMSEALLVFRGQSIGENK